MTNPTPNHCRNGHPRTPDNTHITRDGSRNCRICRAANSQRYRTTRPATPSLPFGPLATWISVYYESEPTIRTVAELCQVSRNKAHRWQRTGRLTIDDADKAAIRLGYHPVEIWPEWMDAA